jgi:hypothetical protein
MPKHFSNQGSLILFIFSIMSFATMAQSPLESKMQNVRFCDGITMYGGPWMDIAVNGVSQADFIISTGAFTEIDNDTRHLKAHLINRTDSLLQWDLDIVIAGKSNNNDGFFPKNGFECTSKSNEHWQFFSAMFGYLKGSEGSKMEGAIIQLDLHDMPPFQLGLGASTYFQGAMGASCWANTKLIKQPVSNFKITAIKSCDLFFELEKKGQNTLYTNQIITNETFSSSF